MYKIIFLAAILVGFLITPTYLVSNKADFAAFKDYYPQLTKEMFSDYQKQCKIYQVDVRLVIAKDFTESNLNPHAVSPAGAIGLGQVMPVHAPDNPQKLFNVSINIKYNVRIFKNMMNRSGDNVSFALARYHAGPNKDLSKYRYWRSYVMKIQNDASSSVAI